MSLLPKKIRASSLLNPINSATVLFDSLRSRQLSQVFQAERSVDIKTIIASAVVGVIASALTAYITTRLKVKEEKEKWRREFAIKFADLQSTDRAQAQSLIVQFAIGVLIKNPDADERERIFIAPNCRLIVGRGEDNAIRINEDRVSRHHCAFVADDERVFVEVLGSVSATFLNEETVKRKTQLKTGDIITIGSGRTRFRFHKLDSN
jgi:hypothetical protein